MLQSARNTITMSILDRLRRQGTPDAKNKPIEFDGLPSMDEGEEEADDAGNEQAPDLNRPDAAEMLKRKRRKAMRASSGSPEDSE